MGSPKVSIIVPVYKSEKTIQRCLDSIINQTMQEWEAILVDDGSPDASGYICDEYAAKDHRFQVIHQTNTGVSAARQAGLDVASGEYVIQVDPDDWVEPKMLTELYNKAIEDKADMVICDWFVELNNKTEYREQRPTSLESSVVLNDMFTNQLHGSCCNKLVKYSCINQFNAKFPEGINYCEDVCFNVQLLKHDIKVSYLNKAYYHYIQNQNSLTNKYSLETLKTQKKYVSFLETQLLADSFPVISSKEFIKKMAYRNAILNDKDFSILYPEVKSVHENNRILSLMYNQAFAGHNVSANLLRKLYWMYHGRS